MRNGTAVALLLCTALGACSAPASVRPSSPAIIMRSDSLQVVPRPRFARTAILARFTLRAPVRIAASSPEELHAAQFLQALLQEHGIRSVRVAGSIGDVSLRRLSRLDARLGPEGYRIAVGRQGVLIGARGGAGLFYGVQTLDQLIERSASGVQSIPLGTILDWPAYPWRGLHLDVSRHFFGVATVKQFINLAAHYKLNTFHWHLTDDQAWRLEIAQYPRLTSNGSCTANGCEFYTRSQIKEIVSYARARFVRIVPEIEMPGHASAATRAYPSIACAPGQRASGVVCSADFYKNVLTEVMQLFPGPYVHVGGDEVFYDQRNATLMRQLGKFVQAHGRQIIAWDDARVAQIPNATLTVWHATLNARSLSGTAALVMSPDGPLYFDAYQGDPSQEPPAALHLATLEEVYDYNPAPQGQGKPQRPQVLGAQANLWTEKVASREHLFYMALPRTLALAEIVWTPASLKNWKSFEERLPQQLLWLDLHGYPYRIPNAWLSLKGAHLSFISLPGHAQSVLATTDAASVSASLGVPMFHARIRYTLDGSPPSERSQPYTQSFAVPLERQAGAVIRFAAFLSDGRHSAISECRIRRISHAVSGRSTWRSLVSP
ncbi:MAG: family 20 glycosylhydrolase [Candidatus Eremiobacteraeota bacterium]|nr:family 20 glycosylhydrolase [Candidatus Eremiobacteraeota bacterium]